MWPCPEHCALPVCVLCVPVLQVMPSWCSCGRCVLSARRSWKQAAAPLQRLQLLLAAALQLAVLVLAQQGREAGECCPALQEVRGHSTIKKTNNKN